jgi:uncharacterized protein (TIGR02271 family)
MAEHIVAVFETETAAAAAEQSLQNAGIPASAIRRYASSEVGRLDSEPVESTSPHTSGGGFWAWLFGEETTSETARSTYTHDVYERRSAAGNVVLSAVIDDDAKIHQAIAALEAHNPIDIDERSEDADAPTASTLAPTTGPGTAGRDFSSSEVARDDMTDAPISSGRADVTAETEPSVTAGSMPVAGLPGTTAPIPPAVGVASDRASEQVLPLSEERLEVGKRKVDGGTTRIRRYVVEKPVEETVALHGERVTVERRQPLETTAAPGTGAFEERVVEVRETSEEPVIAKTARVVEEVVVGREATERTETVKDTVRREEVEVAKDGEVKR